MEKPKITALLWLQKTEIKIIPKIARQEQINPVRKSGVKLSNGANKKTALLKEKFSKAAKAELTKTPKIKARQRYKNIFEAVIAACKYQNMEK